MEANVIGIDLAKNIFQACAVDEKGRELWNKRMSRSSVTKLLSTPSKATFAMEACSGSSHWARLASEHGNKAKLIAPQYVKPYVKNQKNDAHDARAICEATGRPHMNFALPKTLAEQDIQSIMRYRDLQVSVRTMVINHSRGIMTEYGIVVPKGATKFRRLFSEAIDKHESRISSMLKSQLQMLHEQLVDLEAKIKKAEENLHAMASQNPLYSNLQKLPGIGRLTASAILSIESQARHCENGRQFAAYLGLVPRQNSSGGRNKLLGITRTGNSQLRCLLIHGGRALIRYIDRKTDKISRWALALCERRGRNKTVVAIANKNARLAWAMIQKGEDFAL